MPSKFEPVPLPDGGFKVLQLPDAVDARVCRLVCADADAGGWHVAPTTFAMLRHQGMTFPTLRQARDVATELNGW